MNQAEAEAGTMTDPGWGLLALAIAVGLCVFAMWPLWVRVASEGWQRGTARLLSWWNRYLDRRDAYRRWVQDEARRDIERAAR